MSDDAPIAWQVELAQFVPPFEGLHRRFSSGSWIVSKSTATLTINSATAILAIVLNGNVYEEHRIPDLSFAWPRSTGSSRVIFGSYVTSGMTYKFGMRFQNDDEATTCFNVLEKAGSSPNGTALQKVYGDMDWTAPEAVPDRRLTAAPEVIATNSPGGAARSNASGPGSVCPAPEALPPCPGSTNKPSSSGHTLKEQVLNCLMDPSFPAYVNEVEKIWHEIESNVESLHRITSS